MADQPLNRIPPENRFGLGEGGQALVETSIFLWIYLLIIWGLFFFAHAYDQKITVVQAARYAGMLYSMPLPPEEGEKPETMKQAEVKAELVRTYYADCAPERLRVCDRYQGECDGETGDTIWDQMGDLFGGGSDPIATLMTILNDSILPIISRAEVEYDFINPFVDTPHGVFTEQTYTVSSSYTIEANSWAFEETEGVSILDIGVRLLWDIADPPLAEIAGFINIFLEWEFLPDPIQDILELIFTDPED